VDIRHAIGYTIENILAERTLEQIDSYQLASEIRRSSKIRSLQKVSVPNGSFF
jgi:hypothetical protein